MKCQHRFNLGIPIFWNIWHWSLLVEIWTQLFKYLTWKYNFLCQSLLPRFEIISYTITIKIFDNYNFLCQSFLPKIWAQLFRNLYQVNSILENFWCQHSWLRFELSSYLYDFIWSKNSSRDKYFYTQLIQVQTER